MYPAILKKIHVRVSKQIIYIPIATHDFILFTTLAVTSLRIFSRDAEIFPHIVHVHAQVSNDMFINMLRQTMRPTIMCHVRSVDA